ncbi:MAG: energy-coupled thiamine transporter ThiT [Clostridiales bacterium GWF2_38_85]|nr:MAG: energy-coupled thiamine transporter ThiT [Clostridiales bacterium GWF2_38_85]HBL84572.1 energy-coupled thiamine transporter ThiT [Clostridiales bacterium]
MRTNVRNLVESAIMIALATVLSLIKVYEPPLGGSVTILSMVPIILLSYRLGIKWGLSAGFVYSLIQLMLGWANVGYAGAAGYIGIVGCVLLDYIFPFTSLGLAGLFKNKNNPLKGVLVGAVVVVLIRFLFHYFSGVVIWYEITKEQNWNEIVHQYSMWVYSLIYNGSYMGPELITTAIGTPIIYKYLPKNKTAVM